MNNSNCILNVQDLSISFKTEFGIVNPVSNVSFSVKKNEILGIVGESGCGKSVTAYSILRLLPNNSILGEKTRIEFEGENILAYDKNELANVRGEKISMIFQEPMTSLNPIYTVGWQLAESFILHRKMTEDEIHRESMALLEKVRIPEPEKRLKEYPHQLSGGMRQRVMIAMALACQPRLLIADEPTTALDVTTQAQILELINDLKDRIDASIILITHDLGVIAEMCDRVIVMYAGNIVEIGDVYEIFDHPGHPYTKGLMSSIPNIEIEKKDQRKLSTIKGYVPHPANFPKGCRFNPRCRFASERCIRSNPELFQVASGTTHYSRCWLEEKSGDDE
ncbi:MAG TPA: ABC transporter ATP-binding protein [Thermotogota bacterium]|nr:ABC transporter ATP-binding protein [Thermotogota bacterium]HPJ87918.1 ABC transporter ATP-binding protein [Thermotogota bacterium]HPR95011.1 ABC transporter ATP-binding protein [Thermotogota bacterium]